MIFQQPLRWLLSHRIPSQSVWCGLCAAMLVLAAGNGARAQRYLTDEVDREAKRLRSNVSQAMSSAAKFEANRTMVDDFFRKYYFPRMTQHGPEALSLLGKSRDYLISSYIPRAPSPAAQRHLTSLVLTEMQRLARANYHPAVRYNAVLTIGLLDQRLATTDQPPVPLPAATASLLDFLEQDELDGVPVPPALAVGALIGLERHARFGIDPPYAERVTTAALALVNQTDPPEDMARDVHHWIQGVACRVLAKQHAKKGPTGPVQEAWTAMLADQNRSLADRCSVAELMKEVQYQGAKGIDGDAAVLGLGRLTLAVVEDEVERARDYRREKLKGSTGLSPRRQTFSRNTLLPEGSEFGRRRLLTRVLAIARGAKSLGNGVSADAKQRLDQLMASLAPVATVASDKDAVDLDITEALLKLEIDATQLIKPWLPADQPADAPADEGFADRG